MARVSCQPSLFMSTSALNCTGRQPLNGLTRLTHELRGLPLDDGQGVLPAVIVDVHLRIELHWDAC